MKRHFAILALAMISTQLLAGPQWVWEAGKQTTNGAITLKSASGGGSYSGTQNPTGAIAKINQSAATQPPTVIIQATASLPIKAVGDACSATDVSSAASEGIAITEDRTSLLSCQSGHWAKQAIVTSAVPTGGGNVCSTVIADASVTWNGNGPYGTTTQTGYGTSAAGFFTGFLWQPGWDPRGMGQVDCGNNGSCVVNCAAGNCFSGGRRAMVSVESIAVSSVSAGASCGY